MPAEPQGRGRSRYARELAGARRIGLAMGEAQTRKLLLSLQDFLDDMTARIKPGTFNRAEAFRGLARGLIAELTQELEQSVATGIGITARAVVEKHALATARLLQDVGSGLSVAGVFAGVDVAAAQAMLSRPELSAAFKTIRGDLVRDVDRTLINAAATGTSSTDLARQLRLTVVGSEDIPDELLLDRRRITKAALEKLGVDPTPANLRHFRTRAGRVANAAQLIARTEMANAEHEAAIAAAEASPVVSAIRWLLSNRHPRTDVCDVFAKADHHGLGPGVFDKRRVPPRPHPRCLCPHVHVLRPEEEWGQDLPRPPKVQWSPGHVQELFNLSPSQLVQLNRAMAVARVRKAPGAVGPDPLAGLAAAQLAQQQEAMAAAQAALEAAAAEKLVIAKMKAAIAQAQAAIDKAKAAGATGAQHVAEEALELATKNLAARRAANKAASQKFSAKNSAAAKALAAAKEAAQAKAKGLLEQAGKVLVGSIDEADAFGLELDDAIALAKKAGLDDLIAKLTTAKTSLQAVIAEKTAAAKLAAQLLDELEQKVVNASDLNELKLLKSDPKWSQAIVETAKSGSLLLQQRSQKLLQSYNDTKHTLEHLLKEKGTAAIAQAADIADASKIAAAKNSLPELKAMLAKLEDLQQGAVLEVDLQLGGNTYDAAIATLIANVEKAIAAKQGANKKASAKFAAKKKLDLALQEAEKIAKSKTLPGKTFGPEVAKHLKTLTHDERVQVIKSALEKQYAAYLKTLDDTGDVAAAELAAKSVFDQEVQLLVQAAQTPAGLKAAVAQNVAQTPAQAAGVNAAQATVQKVKGKKVKAAAVDAGAPRPIVAGDAKTILGKQVGPQSGSNPGGIYEGTDGVRRYVKFYDDPAQARGEALANDLYRRLGLEAPESVVFEHNGKWAHATPLLDVKGTVKDLGLTKDLADKILDGFGADMLTANWDAVGMSLDNVVVLANGRIARIDQGGTFLMRAKAGRKQESLLQQLTEYDAFMSKNPAYSSVFSKAGLTPGDMGDRLIAQIDQILALEKALGGWDAYVRGSFPEWDVADRKKIVDMLAARSKLLAKKRDDIRNYAAEKIRLEREMKDLLEKTKLKRAAARTPEEKAQVARAVAHVQQTLVASDVTELKAAIAQGKGHGARNAMAARKRASDVRQRFVIAELEARGVKNSTARAIEQHIEAMYRSWQGSAQSDAAMGLKFFGVVDAGAVNTYWNGYINLDPVKQQQFLAAGRNALTGGGRFKEEDVITALRAERAFNRAMGEEVLQVPKVKLWRRVSHYFQHQQIPEPASGTVGVFRHNGVTGWTSVRGSYGGSHEFEAEFDWDDVMRSYWWHAGGYEHEHEWWVFGFDKVMKVERAR